MLYAIIYSTCIYVETFSNISLLKSLTAKKCSPLLWNVLENILDPERIRPPGTQKGKKGEPCNYYDVKLSSLLFLLFCYYIVR